jgi:hypothetical protein
MSCVLVLLMVIGVVVVVVLLGCLYPSFWDSISTCLFHIYSYRYNYLRLGEHAMVLWNILDGGLSRSGPLLRSLDSMWGDTPGTNPHQQPLSAWQVSRC